MWLGVEFSLPFGAPVVRGDGGPGGDQFDLETGGAGEEGGGRGGGIQATDEVHGFGLNVEGGAAVGAVGTGSGSGQCSFFHVIFPSDAHRGRQLPALLFGVGAGAMDTDAGFDVAGAVVAAFAGCTAIGLTGKRCHGYRGLTWNIT